MALFNRKEHILGVDISPSAVKLIELSRTGRRFRVEAFAIENFGDQVSSDDRHALDSEEAGAALKRAYRNSGARARRAAAAVPTSSVITRTVPMPGEFKESDLEINVPIEAAQYIPYPIEEIYLDFEVRGPSLANADAQDVMLVASRKEVVDVREAVIKNADLIPVIVDVEAYSLENTFRLLADGLPKTSDQGGDISLSKNQERLTALVDIGAALTNLYILQGESVIFNRERGFGCEQLTSRIVETYEMSWSQAEQAKRSGQVGDDYESAILEPFKQMLAEQIGHELQFFFSSDQFISDRHRVDTIVLAGGGASIVGLDRVVADVLNITTVVANPFKNMGSAARVNSSALMRDAPLLTIACGLAIRSFD